MWDAFGGVIKVFFEKHLFPSIISLIVATGVYILTPDDFWILNKLNEIWYFLSISGCVFILIHVVIFCYQKFREFSYSIKIKNCFPTINKETLEKLWTLVDGFDQEDRKLLLQFVNSGNAPYTVDGNVVYSYGKLLNSKYAHISYGHKNDSTDNGGIQTSERFDPIKMSISSNSYTQYVLVDAFYNALKFSYEHYGQICHFKEV